MCKRKCESLSVDVRGCVSHARVCAALTACRWCGFAMAPLRMKESVYVGERACTWERVCVYEREKARV